MRWERFLVAVLVLILIGMGVVDDPSAKVGIITLILAGYGFNVATGRAQQH